MQNGRTDWLNRLAEKTDINNLGTIVRSLSYPLQAESTLTPAQIARHQARLVSLLSIFNFLGRLVSGFGSDYLLHRRRKGGSQATKKTDSGTGETRSSSTTATATPTRGSIPRVVFLPLTSLLFLLSQLSLLSISHDPAYLFLPTALTGLAHGCLFGLSGIIGLERFGIKSFSQTNGVLALAPALFGERRVPSSPVGLFLFLFLFLSLFLSLFAAVSLLFED